ncbi:hypothetical protein GCM10007862_17750 [Dyella lipolytica]|uniref:RepB plasmid partition domain-containing protein n=1 Tax=Dyella lipolytica TaxID=1867835 RepID=A0ABW8IST3_9GAMM|nr:plasmid partitioning protein RepB C-terminal domain-containing protein [Dyella lipolytica]GLQ46724.1 hypothetical protein GCM10007862_17750 [Dyella lipolytica]
MNDSAHHSPRALAAAFESQTRVIAVKNIIPLKAFDKEIKQSRRYHQIRASFDAIGFVEYPVVVPNPSDSETYFLLDGLLRLHVLQDRKITEVECLVATDEEAYTYNKHVNRLAPVQEHHMIVRAVSRGVSMERISQALDLEPVSVRRRIRLLDGICPEVARLLEDKHCPLVIFELIKHMTPPRQTEAAELMVGQSNYTVVFARALLAATPPDQLTPARMTKSVLSNVTREDIARLERELATTQQRTRSVEEGYGIDNLTLTVTKTYLAKLLRNSPISAWLGKNRPDFLAEFQSIAEISSLNVANPIAGSITGMKPTSKRAVHRQPLA